MDSHCNDKHMMGLLTSKVAFVPAEFDVADKLLGGVAITSTGSD